MQWWCCSSLARCCALKQTPLEVSQVNGLHSALLCGTTTVGQFGMFVGLKCAAEALLLCGACMPNQACWRMSCLGHTLTDVWGTVLMAVYAGRELWLKHGASWWCHSWANSSPGSSLRVVPTSSKRHGVCSNGCCWWHRRDTATPGDKVLALWKLDIQVLVHFGLTFKMEGFFIIPCRCAFGWGVAQVGVCHE
jgi:hypothetical protein